MKASQRASWSSETHSFGWCACAMWPGPQMIGRDAGAVEQRRLGAERHLADVLRRVAARAPSAVTSLPSCVSKPGSVERCVEFDVRARDRPRASSAGSCAAKRLDVREEASRIVERQVAELEVERAVARHDVERGAAADRRRRARSCTARRTRRRGCRCRGIARAMLRDVGDDLARDLHRVDAAAASATNAPRSRARGSASSCLPLCATTSSMPVGSPTMQPAAGCRARRCRRSAGARRCSRPPRRTTARNAAACCRPRAQELRHERETDGREALHVGDAAAVEPVAVARRVERSRVPGLAVDRHDVGVARTARCRRSVALPSAPASVAKRFALRRVVVERERASRRRGLRDSRGPSRSARDSNRGWSCRSRPACRMRSSERYAAAE